MPLEDAGGSEPRLIPKLTSSEFVTAMSHYHRAEIARMAGWRDRLDRTTNWAITVVAAMLSVSLSTPTAHHGVLLFAMILVFLLLWIEARRYRFFDVYRARVRKVERYYFAQIFAPEPDFSANWLVNLGEGLRSPKFLMSQEAAFARRLRRNYFYMFLVLLLAWTLKISTPSLQHEGVRLDFVHSVQEMAANASLGPLPGWLILLCVAGFYASLAYMAFGKRFADGAVADGNVHV